MHLPAAPSDTRILDIIDAWIADLARGDYACAHARTAHDAYYGWTPALLRAVIEGYGSPEAYADGSVYRVTPARWPVAASNALTARMALRRLPKRAIPCP